LPVLSVLKEGCTWRGLPHDFPRWNIVYYYFQTWSEADKNGEVLLPDRIFGELVLSGRVISGREPKTTMIIMNSKSVKNTGTACEKGYDEGKNFRHKGTPRNRRVISDALNFISLTSYFYNSE
jgi:transposase